mgnify:CR=1 FL=1
MVKQQPFVITVSREVGSGGHTLGRLLAEKLNVRFLDKQLIEALQKQFNLTADAIENLKAQKKSWLTDFLDRVSPAAPPQAFSVAPRYLQEFHQVTTDDIFRAEVEILKGFAEMGSCVVAGRSGFFVFKDHPNALHVLVIASDDHRTKRIMAKQGLTEEQARKVIADIDKARENYIQRYAGVSRYDSRNYGLVLKADGHDEEALAGFVLDYIG